MTSLICWVGLDARGLSSCYLASDSRFTDKNGRVVKDCGQKLYVSYTQPDIFGFCGNVLLAAKMLSRVVKLVDSGALYQRNDPMSVRVDSIIEVLEKGIDQRSELGFDILYCHRETEGVTPAKICVSNISWSRETGFVSKDKTIPSECSGVVDVLGSGAKKFEKWGDLWRQSYVGGTSRSVFSAFYDHVKSGDDPFTGGEVQLAGLYRKGGGMCFGVVDDMGKINLLGEVIPKMTPRQGSFLKCYNRLFEVCDPFTGGRATDAQRHARPSSLIKGG